MSPHQSGSGIGPSGAPEAAAPAHAGLPCQNSNNSDKKPKHYRLKPIPNQPGFYASKDSKSAVWEQKDEDTLLRWGMPSGAEAKSAYHLRLNVAAFVNHWGRNRCLFFTLTDEDNLHPTQFARRWNHYLRRHGAWIVSFIRVLEPQRQGRPHYHLLVAVPWDTRPDTFDWEAFDQCQEERRQNGPTARFRELRARYKASAAPELFALWSLLRKVLPRYGLGRAELLPLRKGKEAISEYVGKYLEAGLQLRKHSWKGCRRVEFDRRAKTGWIACSRVFAWHSPNAKTWRKRVGELGRTLGVEDMAGIRDKLGRRWAYYLRETITLSDDADWSLVLAVLCAADQAGAYSSGDRRFMVRDAVTK
ncbi:MAG: hypothetical protein KF897_13430 [Opitutaceae bacterium]|nr:hypothetical protein [Opitutaceae bacterium]